MQETSFDQLDQKQQQLLLEAEKAMDTAYNPYSHFSVGAALLSKDGQIITGSNVENAAFSSAICAERSALVRANAMELRHFEKVAVIAKGNGVDTSDVTAPCGNCRQMLHELAQISDCDLEIIMSTTKKDKIVVSTISELLPLAFGPKDLEIDVKKFQ